MPGQLVFQLSYISFFLFFFSLSQRILRSKNYTEQQGAKGSQFDDGRGRLFFLRSMPDEVLKDLQAFTPFALDRFKDQVQSFVLIKPSQTFFQYCFHFLSPPKWVEMLVRFLALSMSGIQLFRNCKQSLIILIVLWGFFGLFRATPEAYGTSQARGRIGDAYTTAQATLDPLTH